MKNKSLTPVIVIAAMTSQYMRHFTPEGFGINRETYRKHYKKRKGGGHGKGFLVKHCVDVLPSAVVMENNCAPREIVAHLTYCPLCLTRSVYRFTCLNKWHESTLTEQREKETVKP